MKKTIFASIIVLLITFITVVVSHAQSQPPFPANVYDPDTGILTVKLYPGWNTLPLIGIYNPDLSKAINTCGTLNTSEFVKEGYVWSPVEGRYIGGSMEQLSDPNNPDLNILYRDRENSYYYAKEFGGIGFGNREGPECVYTTYLGERADIDDIQLAEGLPKLKIAEGWNFLLIHPWMQDRSLADFVGTCELTEIYLFNGLTKKWEGGTITKSDLEPSFVTVEAIGRIYLMKAANECSFGLRTR